MIYELLFFGAAVVTAVLGENVALSTRQGNLNTYFLYTRSDDGIVSGPFQMPPANELENHDFSNFSSPLSTKIVGDLDQTLQTIVLVHGHGGDESALFNRMLINAFFDTGDRRGNKNVNLIVLDWSDYAKHSYSTASGAVPSIGKALGEYLKILVDNNLIQIELVHLIGFNLGAHVVGYAGRELDGQVARITGLDPSGSQWGSNTARLSKSDAGYVEVIHTDGGGFLSNGIGTPIGDVDIFVNGGNNQPGCLTHACCHNRAYELFSATLTRAEPLFGRHCTNNLQMTLNLCSSALTIVVGDDDLRKPNHSGIYRVNTKRSFPF